MTFTEMHQRIKTETEHACDQILIPIAQTSDLYRAGWFFKTHEA